MADMIAGRSFDWICSTSMAPSSFPTPPSLTDSPTDDWIFCDVAVESYNEEMHEHTLIFYNLARTSLYSRHDYLQFFWMGTSHRAAAPRLARGASR